MPDTSFKLDVSQYDRLAEAIRAFEDGAESVINDVLHKQGGQMITDRIMKFMPVSGRTWKGKRAAAVTTKPFTLGTGNLFVTVKTVPNYNYLYFPDDGSNTRRHSGEQHFMFRGGEAESENIVALCIERLTRQLES